MPGSRSKGTQCQQCVSWCKVADNELGASDPSMNLLLPACITHGCAAMRSC